MIQSVRDQDGKVILPDDYKNTNVKERTKPKARLPNMYHVILLNDDFTPMDFVVMLLQKIFHRSLPDAEAIMMEIHNKGKGIAGTYTLEVAEMKTLETIRVAKTQEHPLQAIVERAE